jgi:sugar phosphate permease
MLISLETDPDKESSMAGKPWFFGWYVLAGIFICFTALVGIQVYTLPLFYPGLIKEFGWTTDEVTKAATLFFLTGAIITPFVSSLFDRFSARGFMIAGALAAASALLGFSFLRTIS